MSGLRLLASVVCALRAVLVYGEAGTMTERRWAHEWCERLRRRSERRAAEHRPVPAAMA